jgi:hypothetical protein
VVSLPSPTLVGEDGILTGGFFNLVEFVNYRALVFVLRGFGHKVYVFALNSFCFALIVFV